ncbi:hypothetical protein [Novipirellula artificiosorum]|uniref:Uncharacterized protein n=1 Tax=Novipirellula artificiosorum TaxID=2528016 RepID=A0A5C6DDQ7_9BACT|nr:hypothetical protein [Novipirellula artificiosorum]TWU34930.1 hypothetical protein Poly41_40740 [Novipirellula artificiosorum]
MNQLTAKRKNAACRSWRCCHRPGTTLLDVAIGSMMLSVILIPSLHLMSRSQKNNRRLKLHQTLLFEADQLVEQTKIALSDSNEFDRVWRSPFANETLTKIDLGDGPVVLGSVRIQRNSDVISNGLVDIDATVWFDANSNGRVDSGEPVEQARTQWAAP